MPKLIKLMSDGLWPIINRITRENELNVYERMVLLNLVSRAGGSGEAFPSQETIAEDTSISVRQVQRALSSLAEAGFLTKERRGFGLGNIYRIEEDFLVNWVSEGESTCLPGVSVPPDSRDSSATQAVVATNKQEGSKYEEGEAPAPTRQRRGVLTEDELESLRSAFPDIDVDAEIVMARDHKNSDKWKTEYRYLLNWMKRAREFNASKNPKAKSSLPSPADFGWQKGSGFTW